MTSAPLVFVVTLVAALGGLATTALLAFIWAIGKAGLRSLGQSLLLRGLFAGLVATVAFPGLGTTTTASAANYTYDASLVARVDVHEFGYIDARTAQVTSVREWSAARSIEARGTSTTASGSVIATEAAGGAGDVLVLGKYPDYIKLADELGARRFSIPDAEWDALTPEARWAANLAVLDQAIADRIPIVLSNPATPEFLTGTYGDEISYLIKQGYEIGPNAMSMVPKGG